MSESEQQARISANVKNLKKAAEPLMQYIAENYNHLIKLVVTDCRVNVYYDGYVVHNNGNLSSAIDDTH